MVVVGGGGGRGCWLLRRVAVNTKSEILKLKIYKIQKILDARRCVQHIKIMQGRKIHKYLQYWQALDIPNLKTNTKYRKYLIIAILKHFRGFEKKYKYTNNTWESISL